MSGSLLAGAICLFCRLNSSTNKKPIDLFLLSFIYLFSIKISNISRKCLYIIIITRLIKQGQTSPRLFAARISSYHIAPSPEKIKAKAGKRTEQDILIAEGSHIFNFVVFIKLPIPHDENQGITGRRTLVCEGESKKVGKLSPAPALACDRSALWQRLRCPPVLPWKHGDALRCCGAARPGAGGAFGF